MANFQLKRGNMVLLVVVIIVIIVAGVAVYFYKPVTVSVAQINCPDASIEILDAYVSEASARALVRNNGNADNVQITSAILYDKNNNEFSTTSPLDNDFDKGKIDTFTFNVPGLSCNTFSRIAVTTNCAGVSAVFSGTPKGC